MTNTVLGTGLISIAVIIDVLANIFLKKSAGFTNKKYGSLAILSVVIAFIALAEAIKIMDLSIAYALFGAFGILLTTIVDKAFFGLKIKFLGIAGIITIITGIVLIKTL